MSRFSDGPDGWIGVDFDRTLAYRSHDSSDPTPGEPVPAMLARVKDWLARGIKVKIFSARVNPSNGQKYCVTAESQARVIQAWCLKHLGQVLEVTCSKDNYMKEAWDDIMVAVEENTGRQLSPSKVNPSPPTQHNVVVTELPSKLSAQGLSFGFVD